MSIPVLTAALLLALAVVWHAAVVLADTRAVTRHRPDGRVYRPGRGWTSAAGLAARRRLSYLIVVAGVVLAGLCLVAGLAPGRGTAMVLGGWAAVVLALLLADRRHGLNRYTAVCLALLAGCLVLAGGAWALGGRTWTAAAGPPASFFAAQLYLVAGVRKLRSRHFMDGGVLIDNLAYNAAQAAAGSHDFVPFPRTAALSTLLVHPAPRSVCRAVAVCAAVGEVLLGLAVLGLLPRPATLTLALVLHSGFLLLSPLRIVPFSAASMGLCVLATSQPLLPGPLG
ncbi:hypothetical protein [Streptomyces uncialis]|uniref:hypothetical protein n=1 Tax=Streptomyces uncialis TaxID=1048205 RepID=UPI0037AB15BD